MPGSSVISALKTQGRILPGHGGILDRLTALCLCYHY
ncbi:phosphatidate cytidylyltransferase [Staphylococcus aureus]